MGVPTRFRINTPNKRNGKRTIGGEIAQGSKLSKKRAENDDRVL